MKKVFVVPYFGKFPEYFQLWLDSCNYNNEFNWILLTDIDKSIYNVPVNVEFIECTFSNIINIFRNKIDDKISLDTAYKLCDFRPVYWMLLDYYNITYDFWGYCDVDLIFGRLSYFLKEELFFKYDRIYSMGHLSLISSSPITKYAFLLDGADYSWKEVFFSNKTFGFDEHHGLNKIWKKNKLSFYYNDIEIVDINPQFKDFRLTNIALNKEKQLFIFKEGKIIQGYWYRKQYIEKEFAYIHLQKRHMNMNNVSNTRKRFLIDKNGFHFLNEDYKNDPQKFLLQKEPENMYNFKLFVNYLRFYKQKIYKGKLSV